MVIGLELKPYPKAGGRSTCGDTSINDFAYDEKSKQRQRLKPERLKTGRHSIVAGYLRLITDPDGTTARLAKGNFPTKYVGRIAHGLRKFDFRITQRERPSKISNP